jgi:hypothetical protein
VEALYFLATVLLFALLQHLRRQFGRPRPSRIDEPHTEPSGRNERRLSAPPADRLPGLRDAVATTGAQPLETDRRRGRELRRAVVMMTVLGPCRGLVADDRGSAADEPPHGR